MYLFHTERDPGFTAMHYERLETKGALVVPVYLGHTVVQTQVERPGTLPHAGRLLVPIASMLPTSPSRAEQEARRNDRIANAPTYDNLGTFTEESIAAWRVLLDGTKPLRSQTKFAEVSEVVPRNEGRTASGLFVVSGEADTTTGLVPIEYNSEFQRWSATGPEMDAMEEIGYAVERVVSQQMPPADNTGMYL